jgi:hypothetical protein
MTVVLEGMSPAQEQGWLVLLDLFPNRRTDWTLIGGQMMYILAAENGVTMPRTTTDMDVVINVVLRTLPLRTPRPTCGVLAGGSAIGTVGVDRMRRRRYGRACRAAGSSVPVALGAVGVGVHGQQVQWVDRHGLPVDHVVLAGTSPAAVAAVTFAWGERGRPDIFGANGPAACDCSSLMVAA